MRSANNFLDKIVASDRLPHAILMVGGELTTKRDVALQLAAKLLCDQANHCGHCQSCHWIKNLSHPDLKLFPNEDETVIKIDDVRHLTQHFIQSTHQGQYKIAILAPAEAMPSGAMNALLKTLEEPPANSLLILLSQYPSLLPATIRSRCQRVVLPAQTMTENPLVGPLSQTLAALRAEQLSPLQAAERWQKKTLAEVFEGLYVCAVNLMLKTLASPQEKKAVFPWFDHINSIRRQILYKLNPNQLLVLEYTFYQWVQAHDAG